MCVKKVSFILAQLYFQKAKSISVSLAFLLKILRGRLKNHLLNKLTIKAMKQLYCIILIMMSSLWGFSQNIIMDMGFGLNFSKLSVHDFGVIDKRTNKSSDLRQSIAIGLSAKVFKSFYLRTEIGTNSYEDVLDMQYTNTFGKFNIFERYSREQWYIAVLPEWRPFDKTPIYLNAGLGIFQTFNASGIVGIHTKSVRGGSIINIGATPKLNENLGIIVNVGYSFVKGINDQIDSPRVSVKQTKVTLGLVYILK